jgi:hypothetical protein
MSFARVGNLPTAMNVNSRRNWTINDKVNPTFYAKSHEEAWKVL